MSVLKRLPRLPIPTLASSCEKYLSAVQPLLESQAEKLATEKAVKNLQTNGGKLQKMLLDYDAVEDDFMVDRQYNRGSFLERFWDDGYLKFRVPVPINVNPYFLFKDDDQKKNMLDRASHLIASSVRFYQKWQRKELDIPNEECESQYNFLFATTRIPLPERDKLMTYKNSRHIVAYFRGNLFSVNVIDSDGKPVKEIDIKATLSKIVEENKNSKYEKNVTVLTTLPRDDWSSVRSKLIQNETNRKSFQVIDSALFNILLDLDSHVMKQPFSETCLLHLFGSGFGRWYDKSLTLTFSNDGNAGVNFEHTWGDGQTVLKYANDVYTDSLVNKYKMDDQGRAVSVEKLSFNLKDDFAINAIDTAGKKAFVMMNSVDMAYLNFDFFGSKFAKKYKCSPDALLQVAFQRAYYKYSQGKRGSTYESCSMKHFVHGRTEVIRSFTSEARLFASLNNASREINSLSGSAENLKSFYEATFKHVEYVKMCRSGNGFERHLLALQSLASENNIEMPDLFNDVSYKRLKYDVMSTSNCSSPALQSFGFGPTTPDCIGLGYSINPDSFSITVSSFKGDAEDYKKCLLHSLIEIQKMLDK